MSPSLCQSFDQSVKGRKGRVYPKTRLMAIADFWWQNISLSRNICSWKFFFFVFRPIFVLFYSEESFTINHGLFPNTRNIFLDYYEKMHELSTILQTGLKCLKYNSLPYISFPLHWLDGHFAFQICSGKGVDPYGNNRVNFKIKKYLITSEHLITW